MRTKGSSPIISRPNKTIFFKKEGRGATHFALFHNAGASHSFMRKLFAHLKKRGIALTFDWPGHGKSKSRADGDYSVDAQGEMIAEFLKKQSGKKWVLVGLNFGANLALEVANLYPNLVSHLVLIEPPILLPPESVHWVEGLMKDLRELPPKTYGKKTAKEIFLFPPSPEDRKIVEKAYEKIDRDIYIATFKAFLNWDKGASEKLKALKIPVLHILTSNPFCPDLSGCIPHVVTGRIVGSGYWAPLEVPEQVNAMIDRFLLCYK